MLPKWPSCGPVWDRKSWTWRVLTYGLIAVGLGVVMVLGVDLAMLAVAADPADPGPGMRVAGGALVICGGGKLPDEIRDRFLSLAGGKDSKLVVIPTAHRSAEIVGPILVDAWKSRGASSVTMLHTRSRDQANDPSFVKPLTEATGVWLGGGLQSLLAQAYAGTEVERQLKALLDRGGVVGGSSAGAAVMTRVMITGGRAQNVMLGEGFDLLPGAIVDQHFLKRKRLQRLQAAVTQYPDLLGFGIDERTAMVVEVRSKRLRVLGDSYVLACVPPKDNQPAHYVSLHRGEEIDMASLWDPNVKIASSEDLDELLTTAIGR
jgi:cyanophycinase